jgi:hypothetical protein
MGCSFLKYEVVIFLKARIVVEVISFFLVSLFSFHCHKRKRPIKVLIPNRDFLGNVRARKAALADRHCFESLDHLTTFRPSGFAKNIRWDDLQLRSERSRFRNGSYGQVIAGQLAG